MTVCVNNQYRLATWDHDLAGAGSLTDEHRKKAIHGDGDWICAHFQRDHQSRILWDQKRKLNVNCNQIWDLNSTCFDLLWMCCTTCCATGCTTHPHQIEAMSDLKQKRLYIDVFQFSECAFWRFRWNRSCSTSDSAYSYRKINCSYP